MTEADLKAGKLGFAARAVLAIGLALGVAGPSGAGEGEWSFQLELMQMEAYGHDQHVLNIHEMDIGPPRVENKRGVTLDTDSGLAYRGELQHMRGQWGVGLDAFWFNTSQDAAVADAAADGLLGPIERVVFEVADQSFASAGPGEVLFYDVLEDTDVAVWTVDLYGLRTLAEKPESEIRLQFGLRIGDFDNDYRAVVGVRDAVGSRLDASSNYGMMMGPIVGLAGEARRGRSTIKGYLGQSVLLGEAELTSMARGFTGPFGETPAFFDEETFRAVQDVAIPITELRLKWTYRLSRYLALGLGANASAWWDVTVPPGVLPVEDGQETLHENTIVFFGLLAAVELTF